jgi:hypothetical protein
MAFLSRIFQWKSAKQHTPWWRYSVERTEWLSPAEYIRLYHYNPKSIKSVHVIPPQIGADDFGGIVVVREPEPEYDLELVG